MTPCGVQTGTVVGLCNYFGTSNKRGNIVITVDQHHTGEPGRIPARGNAAPQLHNLRSFWGHLACRLQ